MAEDDHKFISERLLNLSLPTPDNSDPNVPIPLEACLEGLTAFEISGKVSQAYKVNRVLSR